MMKGGAWAILITMVLGYLGYLGAKTVDHESRISKNETIHERLQRIEKKQDRMLEIISGN